jgi:hypothetical protein
MTSTVVKARRNVMRRIALVVAFTVGMIGLAFGQASTAEDHSAHHPAQNSATSSQAQPGSSSAGATSGEPRAMMQGMMQMMQGMQGMMGKMHQQAQSDQKQSSQALAMQNCPMMSHGSAASSDSSGTWVAIGRATLSALALFAHASASAFWTP